MLPLFPLPGAMPARNHKIILLLQPSKATGTDDTAHECHCYTGRTRQRRLTLPLLSSWAKFLSSSKNTLFFCVSGRRLSTYSVCRFAIRDVRRDGELEGGSKGDWHVSMPKSNTAFQAGAKYLAKKCGSTIYPRSHISCGYSRAWPLPFPPWTFKWRGLLGVPGTAALELKSSSASPEVLLAAATGGGKQYFAIWSKIG